MECHDERQRDPELTPRREILAVNDRMARMEDRLAGQVTRVGYGSTNPQLGRHHQMTRPSAVRRKVGAPDDDPSWCSCWRAPS